MFLFFFLLLASLVTSDFAKCGSNEVCVYVGWSKQKPSAPSTPAVSPTISMSSFACPVSGTLLRGVNFAEQRFGAVISVTEGTVVKAAAEGKVIESRYAGDSFGRYVLLEHSEKPRVLTRYGYLASQSVREGERVKKGEEVGKSGKSPSGEPSLYFELSRDGTPTREPEEICRGARPVTPSSVYDVSSKTQFQASQVVLSSVSECSRETEASCPSSGYAQFSGRSWKKADPVCVFKKTSVLFRVPYSLLKAVLMQESGGDQFAISRVGASGYTQLMPSTAAGMGIGADRLFDPYYNICGGVHYLARQLRNFGSVECALAAYNAGPGDVRGTNPSNCVPNIPETQNYVRSIMAMWVRNIAAVS